ncbi:hypothetical protein, partial [Pseudomonas shirazica]|uniref:hypothetical protein n=1 Tax=Pseudomonas shirazica TaxID=1940636 RepID=UPI0019616B01
SQHSQLKIRIVENSGIICNTPDDIHRQLAEMSKNWNFDEDAAAEFPRLVGIAEQELDSGVNMQGLCEQLQLAHAYAQ